MLISVSIHDTIEVSKLALEHETLKRLNVCEQI